MTTSHPDPLRGTAPAVRRLLLAGLLAGAATIGLTVPAADAQQSPEASYGAPTPLTGAPTSPGAPQGSTVGAPVTAPPAFRPPSLRASVAVQVANLPAAAPDGGGLIDAGQGGFPATVWGASYRPLIQHVLEGMPGSSASPAARDLLRRLMLTAATPPTGMAPPAPDGAPSRPPPRDFAGLRLERVARLGDGAGADGMAHLPTALTDLGGARAWVELNLLTGDGSACDRLPEFAKRFDDPEFQMAAIICKARNGQTDGITMDLDILREQGGHDDAFSRLAESAATGEKAPLRGLTTLTNPTVALARALGRGVPASVPVAAVAELDGAAAAALADLPDTSAALRLAAGDRAAALGQLAPAALAELYKAAKVSPGDLRNAVTVAGQRRGVERRVLLYQALVGEQVPSLKAKVIARAVDLGDPALLAGVWGHLLADQLDGLVPGPDLGDLAPRAVRLFILQGQPGKARPWLDQVRQAAKDDTKDDKAQATYRALLPLAVIGGVVADGQVDWGQWLDALKPSDDAGLRAKAGGLLALLMACGERVDPLALARVVDAGATPGAVPGAPAWLQLDQAASAGRQGEAVVLALAELPEGGPAATPTLVATHVVGALASVGLTADARRLAAEAAAALVLPGA